MPWLARPSRGAVTVAVYVPGRTAARDAPQPGDDAFRFHEKCSTDGTPVLSATTSEPGPCTQSAELQIRVMPPDLITTDRYLGPTLNEHYRLAMETT